MKRFWSSVAAVSGCVLCLTLISGCGGGGKTPEKTVKRLFKATKNKDLDAMLNCFAPDMREMFEKVMELHGKDRARMQMALGGEDTGKLKILGTKIDGNTAEVNISVTTDGKAEEETLYLSKIDGVWLLDAPEADKKEMKRAMEVLSDPERMKQMKKMMEGMAEEMRKNAPKE